MAFKDLLRTAVDQVPGAVLCTLMGRDGIAIDTYEGPALAGRDMAATTVELTSLFNQVRQAASGLNTGPLQELSVAGKDLQAVLRAVTDDYFLALILDARGSSGKGRYLLRVLQPRMVAELA